MAFKQIPPPFDIHHIEDPGATDRLLRAVDSTWAGRPVPTQLPLHELYARHHGWPLVDPKQEPLPANPRDIRPSLMLQARHELVSYLDLTSDLPALQRWALDPRRAAAGRLVHGAGGAGKTRLLLPLLQR